MSLNPTNPNTITETNSQVWIAYRSKNYSGLTQLAKDAFADFSILTNSMPQATIFHQAVTDNADGRLKAIENGFKEGNRANTSIINTINKLWNEKTALYRAAESLYLHYRGTKFEILSLLVSIGADPNIPFKSPKGSIRKPIDVVFPLDLKTTLNPDLLTCLQHGELVRANNLLKELQSNPSNLVKIQDDDNNNGMILAIKFKNNDNNNNNNNNCSENHVLEVIKNLKICGEDFNHANVHQETVLGIAIIKGYRKIINYLILLQPPDSWLYNSCGTIVHLAAGCDAKDVDILTLLINNKPSCIKDKNGIGRTPLHYVKCIEAASCLIDAGADVNAKDENEATPISCTRPKDELLSDWMRLFDPNLDEQAKAQIIKNRSWAQSVLNKISQLLPNPAIDLPNSVIRGAQSLLEEAKPAIANMLIRALASYLRG